MMFGLPFSLPRRLCQIDSPTSCASASSAHLATGLFDCIRSALVCLMVESQFLALVKALLPCYLSLPTGLVAAWNHHECITDEAGQPYLSTLAGNFWNQLFANWTRLWNVMLPDLEGASS